MEVTKMETLKRIKEMKKETSKNSFRWYVLNEIVKRGADDIECYLKDLLLFGSYDMLTLSDKEINKVFKKYEFEITQFMKDLEWSIGTIPNPYKLDKKSFYVYTTFDYELEWIIDELDIHL
jgi:hypothetical protein